MSTTTTAPPLPTILIITGAWHTPHHYTRLARALQQSGHEVHTPLLPSNQHPCPLLPPSTQHPPRHHRTADLSTDTAFVRRYATRLIRTGHTIIAVMHSYGGIVGTNALGGLVGATTNRSLSARHYKDGEDGGGGGGGASAMGDVDGEIEGVQQQRQGSEGEKTRRGGSGGGERVGGGGLLHLVYLCAYALMPGESLASTFEHFNTSDLIRHVIDFEQPEDDEGTARCRPRFPGKWFGVAATAAASGSAAAEEEEEEKEAEERKSYVDGLVSWNGAILWDAMMSGCAWREVPSTYVVATRDGALPREYQEWMVGRVRGELEASGMVGVGMAVREVEGGHCLNFEREGVRAVLDVVKGVVEGRG